MMLKHLYTVMHNCTLINGLIAGHFKNFADDLRLTMQYGSGILEDYPANLTNGYIIY